MSEKPTFTRREFLHTGLAVVSTITTVPAFLSRSGMVLAADPASAISSRPGVPDERVLVVVQLSGGNDGLNTVIPFGTSRYYSSRPGIAVNEKQVIRVDQRNGFGLHPAMTDLYEMMGDGLAAAVHGVGYPNPNRSHFASMDVWHTGDTRGGRGRGWIGKALDADPQVNPGMACVCMGAEAPLATQGKQVKPVAFDRPELFRWAARDMHPALGEAYDALHHGPAPTDDDPRSFVFRTALDAQVASSKVRQAVAGRTSTSFPNGQLADQLASVSKMIRAELPTRVYYVAMGGFDTHANQPGTQDRLLREFSQAMRAFYRELDATGHRSRVMTLAFSEFGRRVEQNASGGTDHGAAGPAFLFGDHLTRTGLVGEHPSLSRLDQGDLIHNVDFRSLYADLLDHWMKLDSKAALGKAYRPTKLVRA